MDWCEAAQVRAGHAGQIWGADETFIIIDWDDTLLCTSFLIDVLESGEDGEDAQMQSACRDRLRAIECVAGRLLDTASCLGNTCIVTNAAEGWVEASALEYLPRLLPKLQGIPVFSAQEMFGAKYPGVPGVWKKLAFQEVLTRHGKAKAKGLNLIAIGDSSDEMEAAIATVACLRRKHAALKLIRFRERPSATELHGQLLLAACALEQMVSSEMSFAVNFVSRKVEELPKASSWPRCMSGWHRIQASQKKHHTGFRWRRSA